MKLLHLFSTPIVNLLNRKPDYPQHQPSSRWQFSVILLLVSAASLLPIVDPQFSAAAQETGAHLAITDAEARLVAATLLLQQGIQQFNMSQFQEALKSWQQALEIYRNPDVQAALPQESRLGEGHSLNNLGEAYRMLGQYQQAIDFYEQSLTIAREIGDRRSEGNALGNLGTAYLSMGGYQHAIEVYEQSLTIVREISNHAAEGNLLNNLGETYRQVGDYQRAINFYEQSLTVTREVGDLQAEGNALGNLGSTYLNLGDYQRAIDFYEQSLIIFREIGNHAGEGTVLMNLGEAYRMLGQYQQAIDFYEQSLTIAREIGDRRGEGNILVNLGETYRNLGDYQRAIDVHQQSLAIAREIGNRRGESIILMNLGGVYLSLGDYQQAIDFYEQGMTIVHAIGNRAAEGNFLNDLGVAYRSLGDYQQAIDFYGQSLAIAREIGDRRGEGNALANLGTAYLSLGDYQQAIDFYGQSLAIVREIGNRTTEGIALGNVGLAYANLGDYPQAIERYQQSLAIAQAIGNRAEEGRLLSNIGRLLALQDQPELAILFLKQSVNVHETIRDDIRGLPQEQQQSFTDTIADSYRTLADLLLQQDRILEAQRVLDLLKVQELDDYLGNVRSSDATQGGIDLTAPETPVRDRQQEILSRAVAVGQEIAQLRQLDEGRSPEQDKRLVELEAEEQSIREEFFAFIDGPEVQALVDALSRDQIKQDLVANLEELVNLQNNLQDLNQNAVLIYPLILEDRLELVLVTPFSEPTRYPVPVERQVLNQAIVEFRQALEDPTRDPVPLAQQLYRWLIEPMAADLAAVDTETLLYAPDSILRYIPLAALHDGEQWLAEAFRVNHITAASLGNLNLRPDPELDILAAAFSEGFHEVQAGDRTFPFNGLPFAGVEVENLAAAFPGTTKLLNEAFSPDATVPIMDDHTIVHLATHAAFVQGTPSDSFILFGNGDRITLEDIKRWRGRFDAIDLIVLSACETGLGDDGSGTGEEILGFGYLMQEAGAEAAIASLWQVSDGGTQTLMDAFYTALNNGHTKAEALRRAQIALIRNDASVLDASERGVQLESTDTGEPLEAFSGGDLQGSLDHPYYWAPFILIGNGL